MAIARQLVMDKRKNSKSLRVMLVDDRSERRDMLDVGLQEINCVLVACAASNDDLLRLVKQCNPDVILVEIEAPGRDTLESLQSVQSAVPRPMVMFTQDDDNQTIRRATQAGVSAYVADGLQVERVRPILDAAIARFQQYNFLDEELRKARQQIDDKKIIDKAKGIVMRSQNVSEDVAYKAMRKLAMDSNLKISEIAHNIVKTAKILGK